MRIDVCAALARAVALAILFATCSLGCLTQPRGGAAAQERAQEFNMNTRFGRMELAMEHVAAAEREAFATRHKAWGGRVRVTDSELVGLRLVGKDDALVSVKIAWFVPEQQELRVTVVRQRWHDDHGNWQLVAEERAEGDLGLLGDAALVSSSPEPHRHAQFPTVRLGE